MAAPSWLEQELEELDQAERFIHETMSNFVPQGKGSAAAAPPPPNKPVTKGVPGGSSSTQVTNSTPKAESEVDKLTSQLIEGLSNGTRKKSDSFDEFNLPPPPDLDDFTSVPTKVNQAPKSPDLPPPPLAAAKNYAPPPVSQAKSDSIMSKSAPPPVLPKPSRSAPLKAKTHTGVNSVTFNVGPAKLAPALERPAVAPGSETKEEKDHKQSLEDELDYVTKNLLENFDNPNDKDMYGYCGKCNRIVEGEKVGCTAMDQMFHVACFVCTNCSVPLHGEQFFAVGTKPKPWCQSCYTASLDKCAVCSETITDRILRATGKAFHPACFNCSVCKKSLDGIPFTVDDDKEIFCVEDYHKKYAPSCSVCNELIMPEPGKEETVRIVALDRSFHVGCYKCESCGVRLTSEKDGNGCFPLDNRVLCKSCNVKLVQKINA